MKTLLNIDNWNRKDQFRFFNQFEEPFFGITVQVDCTRAYQVSKENNYSFFLYYLHASLQAANETEPFRYRIENDQVYVYDQVNASPTINRPDGTFGFSYMDYHPDFSFFTEHAKEIMEEVRNTTGLIPAVSGENVIHYSSIPWLNFTSLSHARSFSFKDSCPKISFGKMTEQNGLRQMPVSIHVHHALMDGFHVAQFVDRFQEILSR
ncbi:MAG TPA: chloramphenicol acetyltransferase [Chitinophagaceae bacterium]|jgi:chloramphenicol O-acetyltransferase type A|nr:chloramphenicol acetyltransferase [Chitinophagaceae bacterium]